MSTDQKEKNDAGNNEESKSPLRGEVLLTGFVKKALEGKTQGQTKHYDTFVQKLAASTNKPHEMRKYLFALKNSISGLTKEFETLVGTALSLSWSDKDEETVDEFVEFLTNLVSSQTYYLHACLRMLIKNFLPYEVKGAFPQDNEFTDQCHIRFQNTHQALHAVLEIVPTAPPYLLPVIKQNFPYMKKPLKHQESYVKNLLELSDYAPSLQKDIFEIICSHLLKIDVEIPKDELEEIHEETTQFDVELGQDEKQDNDNKDEKEVEYLKEDENSNEPTMQNEMAEKLDSLMTIMFEYIKDVCYHDGIYVNDGASDLFDKISEVFLKVIFPTHESCHVQFLVFYLCSFDQIFVNTFLELCWTKFQDANTPLILRQTAAAYIGSIVARAKFITISIVRTSLKLLVNWIHSYIDDFDSTSGRCDINKHGHFYSLCQTIFYIFVFCHKELLEEENGLSLVRQLNFERIITCRLNPLKVCLPSVVNIFAATTRLNEIVFCYTIIEKNNRSVLPVASSTFSSSVAKVSLLNQLDSFFPFDPYLLKRSRKFIAHLYRDWEGIEPNDIRNTSEDEDKEGSLEHDVHSDSMLITPSVNCHNEMCISPGFSKV